MRPRLKILVAILKGILICLYIGLMTKMFEQKLLKISAPLPTVAEMPTFSYVLPTAVAPAALGGPRFLRLHPGPADSNHQEVFWTPRFTVFPR